MKNIETISSSQVVVTRKDWPITRVEDLEGRVVGIQSTTPTYSAFSHGAFKKIGETFSRIAPVADFTILMESLEASNRLDAVITDSIAAKYWIEKNGAKLFITNIEFYKTFDGVAFKQGNKALRSQVQQTMIEMARDGTFSAITKKWFGKDISIITQYEDADNEEQ